MKEYTMKASTDASVNNKEFEEMKISEQTQQGTSGEVALTNLDNNKLREVINQAIEQSMDEFCIFDNAYSTTPKIVSLQELLSVFKEDPNVRSNTEIHRRALAANNEKLAKDYKKLLPCFGVAGIFEGGRTQKHIVRLTMKVPVDIDHIPNEILEEVLDKLRSDEHTYMTFLTASGQGGRALGRIAFEGKEEYFKRLTEDPKYLKEQYTKAFLTVNEYFSKLVGIKYDQSCKDPSRMSFIPHCPNAYVNPNATPFVIKLEPKRPVGRPRKVPTAAEAEKYVEQTLKQQGTVFKHGDRNNYVYKAASEMNGYGVLEDDCIAWAVEKYEEKDFDREEIASTVRSAYTKVDEHGTKSFSAAKRGKSRSVNLEGIKNYLEEMGVRTRFNVTTNKYEVYAEHFDTGEVYETRMSEDSLDEEKYWVPLDDRILNDVLCELEKVCETRIPKKDLKYAIESSFSKAYNPLKDYVESLPYEDDGIDYIEQLANRVQVDPDKQEIHNRFFKMWFVAMVACWIFKDVINHEMLVYIGKQGIFKSTFLRRLLPMLFKKYVDDFKVKSYMNNDEYIKLGTKGLIELDEISALTPRELDTIKSIVTMENIDKRSPYAEYSKERKRMASFCASTNHEEILTDPTGNRRFLVFKVNHILSPFDNPIPYDKVYAQAAHLAKNGFQYWFDDEDNKIVESLNSEFTVISAEEENIRTYFRQPREGEKGQFFQVHDVINYIQKYNSGLRLNANRIREALRKLEFIEKKEGTKTSVHYGKRGFVVVPYTSKELNDNRMIEDENPVEVTQTNAGECINLELPF